MFKIIYNNISHFRDIGLKDLFVNELIVFTYKTLFTKEQVDSTFIIL